MLFEQLVLVEIVWMLCKNHIRYMICMVTLADLDAFKDHDYAHLFGGKGVLRLDQLTVRLLAGKERLS